MVLRFRRSIAIHGLAIAWAIATALAGAARAQAPMPAPRPAKAPAGIPLPQPRPDTAPTPPPPAEVPPPSACQKRLTADLATFEPLPPITGADDCGIGDPVRLSAVFSKDKRRIPMSPPVVLSCPMAEALAQWLREDVADIAAVLDTTLTGIATGQAYQCRGVNGIAGARTSQHGFGNAMDLRAFLLGNGVAANPTDVSLAREFRERIKASACARFTTVLGPGSDGHHEIYIHVDIAPRHNGYRICQWDVREAADAVPLPRERPASAPR